MRINSKYSFLFLGLMLLAVLLFFLELSIGSVSIPMGQVLGILFHQEVDQESWRQIVLNYRLPRALTAVCVGMGLPVAGFLMQTLFRNPLAGPFVLGVSSGASLGVALYVMGGTLLFGGAMLSGSFGAVLAAVAGASAVLFTVMVFARFVQSNVSLLILGLMFGSMTGALVSVLQFFTSAELLQTYVFWTFGSLSGLGWSELSVMAGIVLLGVSAGMLKKKNMMSLALGETYATSMGINVKRLRFELILISCVITGVITAFCGPIAFIGLAVPHLSRMVFKTSKPGVILLASSLMGIALMLACDWLSQMPGSSRVLPINVVTSLFGAPVVIWIVLRRRRYNFG